MASSEPAIGELVNGCRAGNSIRYFTISLFAVPDQLCFSFITTAVIGTSSRPRLSAAFAHLPMCSSETGSAEWDQRRQVALVEQIKADGWRERVPNDE